MSNRRAEGTVVLADLSIGQRGIIRSLLMNGLQRRRILDLGFVPGSEVEVQMVSPLRDPIAYNVRGATIALRRTEALNILVELIAGCE